MRSLIAKEWRESRALIIGFLILAPVASLLIKWLIIGFRHTCAVDSMHFIIPGAFALFVFALSADLAAGDISSGRIAFFAALPMSPAKVWGAKCLFLAGASILYLGYVLLTEGVILLLAGKEAAPLIGPEAEWMMMPLAAVVAAGAATFMFSTLIDRGFAAALAGFGIVAGPGLVAYTFSDELRSLGLRTMEDWWPVFVVLTLASLAGSAVAFLAGRVHLRTRLRRVVVVSAAFLLVVVPVTAWAGISLHAWFDLDAADEDVRLSGGGTTPDGRWALISAHRSGKGPLGIPSGSESWAVNIETGQVRDFGEYGYLYGSSDAFSEGSDCLVLYRLEQAPGGEKLWLRVVYNLGEGHPLSTRSVDREHCFRSWYVPYRHLETEVQAKAFRLLAPDGKSIKGAPAWQFTSASSSWGVAVKRWQTRRWQYGVIEFDSGEILELTHYPHLLPKEPDGCALHISRPILRIPLAGGEAAEIDIGKVNSHATSPDRRCAIVTSTEGMYFLGAAEASVRKIEGVAPYHSGGPYIVWSADSKTFLVYGRGPSLKGTVTAEGASIEEIQVSPVIAFPVRFDGHRVLGFGPENGSYHVADLEGTSRQLLPAR